MSDQMSHCVRGIQYADGDDNDNDNDDNKDRNVAGPASAYGESITNILGTNSRHGVCIDHSPFAVASSVPSPKEGVSSDNPREERGRQCKGTLTLFFSSPSYSSSFPFI